MVTDFNKLYETYYMQVYSYVMTLVKNSSDAEEITQQTFYKTMSGKRGFKGRSAEFTWLCAIAKNLSTDMFRQKAKYAECPKEEMIFEKDVAKKVEDRETLLHIHMVLHNLNEPYKEVFQLRIFGELSFAEIGHVLGKTENWARVTYHRARLKIQERMADYE